MKKLLSFLYPFLKPSWNKVILAFILSIPLAAIKGAQVALVKYIVNSLTEETSRAEVLKFAGILLGLGLLNYPCRFFHFYLMRYVVDSGACRIRSALFSKIQKLPLKQFTVEKAGKFMAHCVSDTQILAQGLKSAIDFIREPLTAIVMLVMAFYSDWQLTLVVLVVSPLLVFIFQKSGKWIRKNQEKVQEYMGHMTHDISEGIHGQKIIKAFNLQDYCYSRFEKSQKSFFNFQMKTTFVEENAHPLVELVGAIAFSGVIVFAHYRIVSESMTTGDFFSFVTALALLMDPLRKFGQANINVNQARAAGERIFSILEMDDEPDKGTIKLSSIEKGIEFKNITFAYDKNGPLILSNFSLTIKKGEKVALVGESGGGKSTLLYLLLRLYPIYEGEIFIDGIPHDQIDLNSLRNLFGYVGQDIFLFNDSIKENLTLGQNIDSQSLKNAMEMAGITNFASEMQEKEETLIGDRGTRLSGGQGQRLTVARAYLKNVDFFIFDEATSALDNAMEKQIQGSLDKLAENKTVLSVAHRLSTIQNYDKIVVLEQGKIAEFGNHKELIQKKGIYYKLYELGQMKDSEK